MNRYSLTHVSDQVLVHDLKALVGQERATTADVLAHIAEVDARRLYLPAAYPSMYLYCVHELRLTEEAACKRIRAARAAREFPAIFPALAEGRLHLSGIVMLAPHLSPENADDLLAAAANRSKAELQQLLAQRFPRPDLPTRVQALAVTASSAELLAPGPTDRPAPGRVEARAPKLAPLSPERFALEFTVGLTTYDKLRYAQALLGHETPAGEIPAVFDLALDALIPQLEKRRFAATSRPRPGRPSQDPRHIPAHVKRTVWERDGGRCTFVSDNGRRCPARTPLEYDHIEPVARGGKATAENVRLQCWAHNQYEAERTFGAGFMSQKREEAQRVRARTRARAAAAGVSPEKDVVPWLRKLGFSAANARLAAERCESIPDASLEDRLRFALSVLAPPHRTVSPMIAT